MKVIVEQGDLLDALMALIKDEDTDAAAEILRKLMKESQPVGEPQEVTYRQPNGSPAVAALRESAEKWNGSPPPDKPSPSSLRLDELRDGHGPVFRVLPKVPVAAGQIIQNADGSKVEMLEPDDLNEKPGHWFAKQVVD